MRQGMVIMATWEEAAAAIHEYYSYMSGKTEEKGKTIEI
jgi:hypothetical protein